MPTVKKLNPINTNIYIEFDMIVDIDFGILRFIEKYFADDSVFYTDLLYENDDNILKGLLLERENYNPISVIAIDEEKNMPQINAFYDQFMDKYKSDIIEFSHVTSILELALKLIHSDTYTGITFICKDKLEEKVIREIMTECNTSEYDLIVTNGEEISVSEADILVVKFAKNLFNYNKLEGKSIYLADLICNINTKVLEEKKVKIPNVDGTLYTSTNEFSFMTMYPYDDSYSINGSFEILTNTEDLEDNEQHYTFENDDEVTDGDISLLEQWLTPEEMSSALVSNNTKYEDEDIKEDPMTLQSFNPFKQKEDN